VASKDGHPHNDTMESALCSYFDEYLKPFSFEVGHLNHSPGPSQATCARGVSSVRAADQPTNRWTKYSHKILRQQTIKHDPDESKEGSLYKRAA
jgi:hypothetical protein